MKVYGHACLDERIGSDGARFGAAVDNFRSRTTRITLLPLTVDGRRRGSAPRFRLTRMRGEMATISPVESMSKADQVLFQLRTLIIEGHLPAKTQLVEDSLALQFDVSRGPIRDALTQLHTEGLVERRRRGVFVKGLTTKDVNELYSLREALETLAVRTVMEEADPAALSRAVDLVAQMRIAAERDRGDEFAVADMQFHSLFYELSNHARLQAVWASYRPTFAVMLGRRDSEDRDLRPTAEQHAHMLDAIISGDVEAAMKAVVEHLHASRKRLLASLAATS